METAKEAYDKGFRDGLMCLNLRWMFPNRNDGVLCLGNFELAWIHSHLDMLPLYKPPEETEINFGAFLRTELGSRFSVDIYENYCIKKPISKKGKVIPVTREQMFQIAEIQNFLASHIDGILPIRVVEEGMLMPTAPGISVTKLSFPQRALELAVIMQEQAEELGYFLEDLEPKNMHYDEENDKLYFIDLHRVKKLKSNHD